MSARPGRFIEVLPTGWPVARSSAIVSEEAFGKLTGHVWSKLRGEAMRALGRDADAAGG
jgi:NitT/TauT family transport system ATP-binding protein